MMSLLVLWVSNAPIYSYHIRKSRGRLRGSSQPLLGFDQHIVGYRAPIAPPLSVADKKLILCTTLKTCLLYILVSNTPAIVLRIYLRLRINETNYYDWWTSIGCIWKTCMILHRLCCDGHPTSWYCSLATMGKKQRKTFWKCYITWSLVNSSTEDNTLTIDCVWLEGLLQPNYVHIAYSITLPANVQLETH